MKKIFSFILVFVLLFTVVSCKKKNNNDQPVHSHEYTTVKYDNTNHWIECSCGEKQGITLHTFNSEVTKAATITEKGERTYTCSVCGYSYKEDIPELPHTHSYSTLKYDETNHWDECECGAKQNVTAHTFNSEVTKEASLTEKGEKTYTCSVCGYSYKEEIPKLTLPEAKVSLNKSSFIEGQYLEYTEIKVEKLVGESYEETTDFTFDLEGVVLKITDTKVVVTYNEKTYELAITVSSEESKVTGIEILVNPNFVAKDGCSLDKQVLARKVYTDGSYSEYDYVDASKVTLTQRDNLVDVSVTLNIGGTDYSDLVTLNNVIKSVTFTSATKLYYTIGESIDLTGAEINIIYNYGTAKHINVTTEMIELKDVDFTTAGEYTIPVSYETHSFSYNINVLKEVSSIEIVSALSDIHFTLGGDLSVVAGSFSDNALKVVYTDSTEEFMNVEADMLSCDWAIGVQVVTLTLCGKEATFNIELASNGISVSEFISDNPTGEFTIHGVVVGYNYSYTPSTEPTSREVIIKDENASKWVAVSGIDSAVVGDVIDFKATSTTANGRVSLVYKSNYVVEYHTDDKEMIELDLSTAITISDNETWKTTFSDANRANTYGNIYKLHGNFGLVWYYETARICFPGVTSYGYGDGKQYFNSSLSGVFRPYMIEANTSYKLTDLCAKNSVYANTKSCEKDVYVIYMGQTGTYYANFVILGDYCIKDYEPIIKDFKPIEELKTLYLLGEDIELIGKQFELSYVFGEDSVIYEVNTEMISMPTEFDKNTVGDYEITITSAEGLTYTYTVSYLTELTTSIELTGYTDERTIKGTDVNTVDLTDLVIVRNTTSSNVYNIPVTVDMLSLSGKASVGSDGYIRRELIIEYEGIETKVFVKGELTNNISTAFTTSSGTSKLYYGVVVGYNFTGNSSATTYETVVKDITCSQVICVNGIGNTMVSGDLVVFTGVTSYGTSGDNKYRIGLTVSSNNYAMIGHTDDKSIIELDLTGAKLYTDHNDLQADFTDALRGGQYYKVVKFDKTLKGNRSYDNIWRIFLPATPAITALGNGENGQYFNGKLSPVMKTKMIEKNLGIKANDFLGNVKSWTDSPEVGQYVYAIYCGSVGDYYGDFVILGSYMLGGAE